MAKKLVAKKLWVSAVGKPKCPGCGTKDVQVYGLYEYITTKKRLILHMCSSDECMAALSALCHSYVRQMQRPLAFEGAGKGQMGDALEKVIDKLKASFPGIYGTETAKLT